MYARILLALLAIFFFCCVHAQTNRPDSVRKAGKADTIKRSSQNRSTVTSGQASQKKPDTLKLHADAVTKGPDNSQRTIAHTSDTTLQKQINILNQRIQQLQSNKLIGQLTLGIAVIIIVLLLGALNLRQKKIKKMAAHQAIREEMIQSYTRELDTLYNYLLQKGLLNTHTQHAHESFIVSALKIKIDQIKNKVVELVDRYLSEDARSASIAADTDDVRNKLKKVVEENFELTKKLKQYENNDQPASAIQYVPYVAPENAVHIKSEIMISAGPRKEPGNADTELGEDVAGMLSLPKQTFFWLMDGTSEAMILSEGRTAYEESHIFSSRLLAQSIGQYVQKHITECFHEYITLDKLLEQARAHVQNEWVQRINALPAERKQAIKQLIQEGQKPLCSTTAIIGRLMENGHLHVLRAGDSKVFPFVQHNGSGATLHDFRFSKDPTDDNDRVAFRLDYNAEEDAFEIRFNKTAWAIESAENINLAFVFTDGIGRVVEAQLNSNNPGITEVIKQNIARIPQKTYDDKTLIVLERILNP